MVPRIEYRWRGYFSDAELEYLHASAFKHPIRIRAWKDQLHGHSLGWVTARRDNELVGFVNVAWDGASHAFLLDTAVMGRLQGHGIGTELVRHAAQGATATGCEWLHVDFEEPAERFYVVSCGFVPTRAGLLRLSTS